MKRFLPLALVLVLIVPALHAQDPGSGRIRGDPGSAKPDPRALGALGGEGIFHEPSGSPHIRGTIPGIVITSLRANGAGYLAGLREGDRIIGVDGSGFGGELPPFLALAAQLEKPRKDDEPAIVRIFRDGEMKKIPVLIPGTAKHPRSCPEKCPRCEGIRDMALEQLARMQNPNGSFPTRLGGANGLTAVTTIAGLAFLAAGSTPTEGPYAEQIRKARQWLVENAAHDDERMSRAGGKNWSQVNWALGYAPLFLARVQALDPNDETRARLEEMKTALLDNMEPSGGWAHGPRNDLPYPLDYAELTAVGNICLAALGEIQSLGIEVPTEKVALALDYIEKTSDGSGGVGYSTRPGQQGIGSAGRSASALLAMSRLGLERRPFYKKLTGYLRRNLEHLPEGHVSPDFHYFFGALACRVLGKKDWVKFYRQFRTEILSLHNGDGTFGCRPADTSRFGLGNTDRTMGEAWRTATFAMILGLASGHLDKPAGELR